MFQASSRPPYVFSMQVLESLNIHERLYTLFFNSLDSRLDGKLCLSFLYKLRDSVSRSPLCMAFPCAEYYQLIRLPMCGRSFHPFS